MQRLLLTLVLALALTGGAASTADARVAVGVGEQDYAPFADSSWKGARTEEVPPRHPVERRDPARARPGEDGRLLPLGPRQRGRAAGGVQPAEQRALPAAPVQPAELAQLHRAFRSFRRRYPRLKVIAPWNEANHISQPTFSTNRGAKAAATYYNIVRATAAAARSSRPT